MGALIPRNTAFDFRLVRNLSVKRNPTRPILRCHSWPGPIAYNPQMALTEGPFTTTLFWLPIDNRYMLSIHVLDECFRQTMLGYPYNSVGL